MSEAPTIISSRLNERGMQEAHVCLTPTANKSIKIIDCDPRPIVPVIFLPGVMGTNLKTGDGGAAWIAPNMGGPIELIDAILSLLGWAFRGAADRQKRLNPKNMAVDNTGTIDVGESGLTKEDAKSRGWGEVHKDSYHGILAYLQVQLNNPMLYGEPVGDWVSPQSAESEHNPKLLPTAILGTAPSRYGAVMDGETMDVASLKVFAAHQYPVFAVGYNWAQSNAQSAADVFIRIQKICKQYGAEKAIVVTHSMGGIVARGMNALIPESRDLIVGIVHGAQPARGAPIAAKRFRTGVEGGFVERSFFGANADEWTAVSASSPAALELMPMPDYLDGKPWWFIQDDDGNDVLALPQASAAEELYDSTAWYALIPDSNEALIDPAGIIKNDIQMSKKTSTVRGVFVDAIKNANQFQASIGGQYHPRTYALYGEGASSDHTVSTRTDEELRTYGIVRWRGSLPVGTTAADLRAATLVSDNHRGVWKINVRGQIVTLTVRGPDQAGDGTVPAPSAAKQNSANGVRQSFKQAGYDHQFCYNHPWARWAALYGVAQISQSIVSTGP
ncbi:hypothetical protein [Glaciimonas sp. PAMC28666]|uniref:lipase family alpha/beta hydrolase n=1 Tax=Glaciimonas sp. PAMC28666 TaxID=2807626 RepID=UPI00196345C7|nr:hypothetical protein [Glaciimonas sp. PAMC28666]QRX84027.1 hypothetical protein JQN73_07440 [Glaciimonas sp. PAMC28666]